MSIEAFSFSGCVGKMGGKQKAAWAGWPGPGPAPRPHAATARVSLELSALEIPGSFATNGASYSLPRLHSLFPFLSPCLGLLIPSPPI